MSSNRRKEEINKIYLYQQEIFKSSVGIELPVLSDFCDRLLHNSSKSFHTRTLSIRKHIEVLATHTLALLVVANNAVSANHAQLDL